MKRLILDRGFLDGQAISPCKRDSGIDIFIPARRTMDIYEDAMTLFREPDIEWVCLKDPVVKVEEPARPRPHSMSELCNSIYASRSP